jgi:histidyl-tRNA synthetase
MSVQAARGTRDFLPAQMHARLHVLGVVREVFARFGFEPLETPAVERLETLMGKYGDEGDKLVFRILERGEGGKEGKADLGLRYDLTVPLARVMAQNQSIPLPFKRYQIQPVWRAERPQKGRFREFVQCDADIVGAPARVADAECVAVAHAALEALGFTDFTISVNHRALLSAIVASAGLAEHEGSVLVAVDKLDKIGWDGVTKELEGRGIDPTKLRDVLAAPGELEAFRDIAPGPVAELEEMFGHTYALGATRVRFDATLARGLGYYTGPVYEAVVEGSGVGSVSGGGRYDNLVGVFSGRSIPAVGVSLGIDRLLTVMEERKMLPGATTRTRALVATFSRELAEDALQTAARLRASGVPIESWLGEPGSLGKQFKYAAARGIPYVVVRGPEEVDKGVATVKDLRSGEQRSVAHGELPAVLRG